MLSTFDLLAMTKQQSTTNSWASGGSTVHVCLCVNVLSCLFPTAREGVGSCQKSGNRWHRASNKRKHCLYVLHKDINLFRHIVLRCILLLETKYESLLPQFPIMVRNLVLCQVLAHGSNREWAFYCLGHSIQVSLKQTEDPP